MIEVSGGPLLRGVCNQCGQCCVVQHEGVAYSCDFLVQVDRLGQPRATLCLAYAARTHRMPITLTNAGGATIYGQCMADGTEEETRAIIAQGISRGCSLEVVA